VISHLIIDAGEAFGLLVF